MDSISLVKMIVSGKVQGVSFRWFTVQIGKNMGLKGYAKNHIDGTVEIHATGNPCNLKVLIEKVKIGPPTSRVDHVEIEWGSDIIPFTNFEIRYS